MKFRAHGAQLAVLRFQIVVSSHAGASPPSRCARSCWLALPPLPGSAAAGTNRSPTDRHFAFERSKLALAPLIRSRRKYWLPRLDIPVCTKNLIHFDCLRESHNVGDDGVR